MHSQNSFTFSLVSTCRSHSCTYFVLLRFSKLGVCSFSRFWLAVCSNEEKVPLAFGNFLQSRLICTNWKFNRSSTSLVDTSFYSRWLECKIVTLLWSDVIIDGVILEPYLWTSKRWFSASVGRYILTVDSEVNCQALYTYNQVLV